jgi:hypothetical protein
MSHTILLWTHIHIATGMVKAHTSLPRTQVAVLRLRLFYFARMERTGSSGGDRGVVFHAPKQKKEFIAKSIQKSNSNLPTGAGDAGNHTISLRHNPPAEIIEPKGETSLYLF